MSNEMNQQPRKRGPMGRMGRGMQPGEKPKDLKKSIKQLAQYIGKYKIAIFIVMICAACSTVFNVAGPKILGKATTALSEGLMEKIRGTGSIDFTKIGKILLFTLGLYLMSALFSFIQGWIMTGVTQKVCYRLRKEISEKINRMPMKYFESRTYGEVLSRITNDVDTLGQGLNQSITTIITSVATLVGVLIMMLSISPLMTLIALVILPISMGLIGLVTKKSQKFFRAQQEYLGHINGQVEEVYGGHLVIKAFNRERDTIEEFEKTNNILYDSAWKSQFLSGMMQPIMMFVGNLGYACVALTGGLLAIKNVITIGDIQAFIQYVRQFNQPISQIAQAANLLQSTGAAAERVFEFLEEKELTEDSATLTTEEVQNMKGAVTFADVHFGYNPDKIIINDFSLHVHAGQKVAIVGPTGAGKTTIIKLLMRFYELNGGSIMIDGEDITQMKRSDLRSLFGMVLQDTWLFNGTIMDNLKYGRLDATDEEVKKACVNAHVDHFIHTLSDGYNTMINEESSNISAGQKQLLTIARAFLKDPKILILDEATSSVDTRTEVLIQQGMDELMKNRTSFVIAHRLSTIRDADTIIVMRDGDIVEIGNHEGLLKENGFYATLYRSQFENGQ